QRPILLLQLREQPHVLNGDRGLVGERLEEGNLTLREETRFGATNHNRTDCEVVLSHEGHAENRAVSHAPRDFTPLRKLVDLGLDIGDVDGASVQNRSPGGPASNQRLHRCSWNRTLVSTRCRVSPSRRYMTASNASHSRLALRTIVSKTG